MSAAAKLKPAEPVAPSEEGMGLQVTHEQLVRFGDGDARRGRRDLRLLLSETRESPIMSGPTKRPETVRIATPADEPAVMALLLLDVADNAAQVAPPDEDRILAAIQVGTRQRGGIVGVIDGPDGTPVGVIVIHPQQWWWANGWYWFEVVNFVHPDHRYGTAGQDLRNFGKWWSDDLSRRNGYITPFLCGVLGAWRVHAKVAAYRRSFWQVGACFLYPAPKLKGR